MSMVQQSEFDQTTISGVCEVNADQAPELFSEVELREWCVDGCVTVQSPSRPERVYQIMVGGEPTVVLEYGREVLSLWLDSAKQLSVEQGVLVEKLLIESAEPTYLRLAKPSESVRTPRHDFLDNGMRDESF